MDAQKAADQLKKIDNKALDQRYQGLYMLFDHSLQRELFDRAEGTNLKKLGVDISRPKAWPGHLESAKIYPKPSKALLEQGGIGKKNYDALLRIDHFVNLDSDELIRLAKQQYDLLEGEIKVLSAKIDPNKDWRDVYRELRKSHPTKEGLLDEYRKEVDKARAFLKAKDLISIPKREKIEVIETPAWYRDSVPFAAYLPQGNGRGQFFVTTLIDSDPAKEEEQLRAHNYGFIPSVVVHEAYPGHHIQHAHTDQVKLDPTDPSNKTLRKVFEMTPYSAYFGEGWGVYSEEMMREQGYYAKGTEKMRPEAVEMVAMRNVLWRAARAWIDPQVNTGKMTYEQAVDFLVDRVLMERDRAELEVNRYFRNPTEVPSYMVGKLQFQQLREQLKTGQGKAFVLKNFHDEIFKEGKELPVPVIARMRFDQPLDLPKVEAPPEKK